MASQSWGIFDKKTNKQTNKQKKKKTEQNDEWIYNFRCFYK